MWLLFGGKSKFKQIPGGRQVERRCDDCDRRTTFLECDVTDTVDVWFVDVFSSTQRRLVCRDCGADVDLGVPASASPRAAASAVPAAARPVAGNVRPAAPSAPPSRRVTEREKDDMLAALKRKMGRA